MIQGSPATLCYTRAHLLTALCVDQVQRLHAE